MSPERWLASLTRRNGWTGGPLAAVAAPYIASLCTERYAPSTINSYLRCVTHLALWMKIEGLDLSQVNAALMTRFLQEHLPACTCSARIHEGIASTRAALAQLLRILPPAPVIPDPYDSVAAELKRFQSYLLGTCGLAPVTVAYRVRHIEVFLTTHLQGKLERITRLTATDVDRFVLAYSKCWQPASLRILCGSMRSYFRFRAFRGEPAPIAATVLPRIADWGHSAVPPSLSEAQLTLFLQAFDRSYPTGQRDYAIARCLVDLGLRGQEVAFLRLEAVDWRAGTLTLTGTKGKRTQRLPLPVTTGQALAAYLRHGRPRTIQRTLFVRHVAPFDKPLAVTGIRAAMNRAFARCGLDDQFCNTHVLRHTTAVRLQRAGVPLKEIADVLRHRSLDTTTVYARVDWEALRAVALPWPGSTV